MITERRSIEAETITEQMETQPVGAEETKSGDLMNLMLKFLESPGNVLLIHGTPGAGKTTLGFELLRRMEGPRIGQHSIPPNRLYVSSRVSPAKLRKHFPWINEVVDSQSGRIARANWTEAQEDVRVSEADNLIQKVLALKRSVQKGLIVIDSWEGAIRNANEQGIRMLESAILSEPDESKFGVVLVSEEKEEDPLSHLVDGVVTLSSSELEGRRIRTLVVNKLRGFRVRAHQGLFTLENGRFTFLPDTEFFDRTSANPKIPKPVPHSETSFSTGSPDLDKMLGGGVKRGSSFLIDLNASTVSPEALRILLNIIRANFVNQGGSSINIPSATLSSESVAESLKPLVGNATLEERVRIAEYNQGLPPRRWRIHLKGKLLEDVNLFNSCWNELRAISSSTLLTSDFDRIVQTYGEDLTLPGLAEIGANIRDSGALSIGVASQPTKVREEFLRIADYHLKMQHFNGSLVIYGVKPFTNIHGLAFAFERGCPSLRLTEVV